MKSIHSHQIVEVRRKHFDQPLCRENPLTTTPRGVRSDHSDRIDIGDIMSGRLFFR